MSPVLRKKGILADIKRKFTGDNFIFRKENMFVVTSIEICKEVGVFITVEELGNGEQHHHIVALSDNDIKILVTMANLLKS